MAASTLQSRPRAEIRAALRRLILLSRAETKLDAFLETLSLASNGQAHATVPVRVPVRQANWPARVPMSWVNDPTHFHGGRR